MIKLTRSDDIEVYVNPDDIKYVSKDPDHGEHTILSFGAGTFALVQESPEEVARMVLEYRLKMEEHKAWIGSTTHHVNDNDTYDLCDNQSLLLERELYRLAGLVK